MAETHHLTLDELSHGIRTRRITSAEAAEHTLQRISELDPTLGAYSYVDADGARRRAGELDAELASGTWRGPLHGVPVAVKDIFDVAGWPSEIGMASRRGRISDTTATVVHRLVDAGAVVLGKVHTTEGVYAEHTPPFQPPKNPWNRDRWVGVSSSGSAAAAAAGLAFAALASDTGGSIRMPTAANGLTGIKPTWGRVSRAGVFELAASLDHVGVIARSAADVGVVLGVIAGPDPSDPTAAALPVPRYPRITGSLTGVRIGLDAAWVRADVADEVHSAVLSAVDALVGLGAEIVPIVFPATEQINDDWFGVCGVQAALAHDENYRANASSYGTAFSELIELGRSVSGMQYQELLLRRAAFTGRVRSLFVDVDALVIPALPFVAPPASEMVRMSEETVARVHRFTVPFTMSRLPTVTLPGGFSKDDLPVAVQIVGDAFHEALILGIATAFQGVTDWHRRHPAL